MATIETAGGQMVEVAGTFDAAGNFIIQDPDGLFAQTQNSSGKSLLKPELTHHIAQQSGPMKVMVRPGSQQGGHSALNRSPFSSGQVNTSVNDARWLQQSTARGGKVLPRKPVSNAASGFRYSGSQLTSGSIMGNNVVSMSSGIGGMGDRDSLRLAVGTSSRGRPRGRRPLRGQFPVVPIDMVRQLGIEQQVILQPPFPVAMCNKGMLSKPLSMSKKTQCWPNHMDIATQTSGAEITEADSVPAVARSASPAKSTEKKEVVSNRPVYIPVPMPLPIYVPLPMRMFTKRESLPANFTTPYPLPADILLYGTDAGEFLRKSFLITAADVTEAGEKPLQMEENEPDLVNQMLVSEHVQEATHTAKRPAPEESPSRQSDVAVAPEPKRPCPAPTASIVSDSSFRLKFSYGINAWRHWVNNRISNNDPDTNNLKAELLEMDSKDLAHALARFVVEVRKPNNECYVADSIFYLCLGIQEYLNENGREESLFGEPMYAPFTEALDQVLANFIPRISPDGLLICRIEEEHLWEAKQLGDRTPQILLFTVLYFNTKIKCLSRVDEHSALSLATFTSDEHETRANNEEPYKCPVNLLKAFMQRCPPTAVRNSKHFYLTPLDDWRSGEIWFSDKPLKRHEISMMFNRVKLVKEIQEVMHNQTEDTY